MFSLHGYFDAVVSGECTENGKPHPDIYLHTAERLGVDPSECVAIEDSINGVRSAMGAGMYCIAVPDKRLSREPFESAHLILESLDELRPEAFESFRTL
jgi:beta-phosphoglucomutase-like phosphatase (HAD superfamily)